MPRADALLNDEQPRGSDCTQARRSSHTNFLLCIIIFSSDLLEGISDAMPYVYDLRKTDIISLGTKSQTRFSQIHNKNSHSAIHSSTTEEYEKQNTYAVL